MENMLWIRNKIALLYQRHPDIDDVINIDLCFNPKTIHVNKLDSINSFNTLEKKYRERCINDYPIAKYVEVDGIEIFELLTPYHPETLAYYRNMKERS